MFTDEEYEAAVLRYLTSEVTTTRSEAGTRDVVAAKTQVYEIISAAFLLRPAALFAVCWMASNNLRALVIEQLADMQAILEAAPRVSKTSLKVESTTDLHNAEASLLTLTSAFSARSRGVAGGIGPAIQRFSSSIERFMRGELAKNTVEGDDIVRTPEELRVEVAARWKTARARHEEIVSGVENLAAALDTFTGVRLPDSVVGSLLVRIQTRLAELTTQMEATTAARDSRTALLDLSAMRTLLAQAARFKVPELKRAPLTGDAPAGVLLGSTGSPASILGTVSGPFNYGPGTTLQYSVGGAAGSLVLPGSSGAELRGQAMLAYTDPPSDAECAVRVDGTTVVTAPMLVWGDGETAALALDAALEGVAVTWDAVTGQLVFRSESVDDGASLELLGESTEREAFCTWLLASGTLRVVRGVPVPIDDIVTAIRADARLVPSVVRQLGPAFAARRSASELDVLIHRLVEREDLVGDGTAQARAAADLEALGVEAGMVLVTTAPTFAFWPIVAVSGPVLELQGTLPAGTHTYYVGANFAEVELGSRVYLAGNADAGLYRVVLGGGTKITLDRALTSAEPVQVTSIVSELLALQLRDTSSTATLTILDSPGATALGLLPQAVVASLDTFDTRADLGARGAEVGDILVLENLTGGQAQRRVASIAGTTVRLTEPVRYEATELRYVLRSAPVQDYVELRTDLRIVQADNAFSDATALDQTVGRLARGARYIGELATVLTGYIATLLELVQIADEYEVQRDPTVEQALRVMVEHGFDRAADLFVALRLDEFFALDADGVSYKTWVMRTAADVVREVVPVTKSTRDPTSTWRTLSVQPSTFDPTSRS
jgi:hypothetical protein